MRPAPPGPALVRPAAMGPDLVLQAGLRPIPEYELVKRLGSGGFGEVWQAAGPGGFPVALKFIRLEDRSGVIELRSLALMKDIRHPHLLAMFGTWEVGGWLIIAMELGDRTLEQRLIEAKKQDLPGIPLVELLETMLEAAKGIDHLNELGIQHRDIKPQNFLLVGGGLKVADFGLAKILEKSFVSNSGAMTPGYAAPEFFQGQTSPHSDQYSLGITYCYLRGGRLPFGGNAMQIMFAHLQEEPDLSMMPERERPAVLRALAKRPEERWPNCRTFVNALYTACGLHRSTLPLEAEASGPEQGKVATPALTRRDSQLPEGAPTRVSGKPRLGRWLAAASLLGLLGLGAAGFWFQEPLQQWTGLAGPVAEEPTIADNGVPEAFRGAKAKEDNRDSNKSNPRRHVAKGEPATGATIPDGKNKAQEKTKDTNAPLPAEKEKPKPKVAKTPEPVASLKVVPPAEVTVHPGRKTAVQVQFQRAQFTEPIRLSLSGLPDGVVPINDRVPAGLDQMLLELKARPGLPEREFDVTITATGGDLKATGRFRLVVKLEKEIVNAVDMKLVLLPAGNFFRGSPPDEPGRGPEEGLVGEMEISRPFYLGAHEVTQEQFDKVMKRNPSWFQESGDGKDEVRDQKTPRLPVEMVSWEEAVEFCRRLSELPEEKEAGRVYRLPTETEWEYACRAGSSSAFAAGAALTARQANILDKVTGEPSLQRTTAVGSYLPNAWGLFDMHGNVFEWCGEPVMDPSGPKKVLARVLRGGAWCYTSRHARSAARNGAAPDFRSYFTGFRVACNGRLTP